MTLGERHDKIIDVAADENDSEQQQRTLKTEQYVKPWKFLKNKGFWLSLEVRENIQNKKTKQQ